MYNGERLTGAAKGKQTNTMASCQTPPQKKVRFMGGSRGVPPKNALGDAFSGQTHDFTRG